MRADHSSIASRAREPKDRVMSSSPGALGVAFAPGLVKGESR